jgi:hypothetical protein
MTLYCIPDGSTMTSFLRAFSRRNCCPTELVESTNEIVSNEMSTTAKKALRDKFIANSG